jgi:hypothetical protein
MKSRRHEFFNRLATAVMPAVAMLLLGGAVASGQGRAPLFRPVPSTAAADARGQERGLMRARRVVVDLTTLRAAGTLQRPDSPRPALLLNLFDDVSITAELERLETAPGGTVWVGRVPGLELSSVTLSTVGQAVAGTVATPGAIYSIRYTGGGVHEIAEVDQSQFPSGPDAVAVARDAGGANAPAGQDTAVAADVLGALIDVMAVYTPAARIDAGGSDSIAALINQGISDANTSYANSGITQRMRLVRSAEVPYTEGDMLTDLANLRNGVGALSGVNALRDSSGADAVVMIGSWPMLTQGCGYAYVMKDVSGTFASSAFSVVNQPADSAASCISGNYSLAHELGHNMGANHDWYMDNDLQPYTYAHAYAYPAGRWRTMMAYNDVCTARVGVSCTRLLYWSNPSLTNGGVPMGVPAGTRSDCLTLSPSSLSCDADNRSTLNNTAATVAGFRRAVSPVATPMALRFAAWKAGASGPLTAVTGAQVVTVDFSGTPTGWTATASQPWIQVTNGSGIGPGQFSVAIVNPNNILGGTTSASATVTIQPAAPGLVPATVSVSLTVNLSGGASAPPFGQVDTPAQASSGLVGSIGVTGWALDDVGVTAVKIYRNCLPFDYQPNCQPVGGLNLVYIGDAAFLAGARSDVEAGFPSYPQAYRAGWGYLMLTNMLPHVPNAREYGGQGTVTLYAFASDVEGHLTLLGRSWAADQTPTTISLANETIAKPFGSLDTPGQGQTVSGVVANFGWVLTPDGNTLADAGDILLPTNGSTIVVYIDGQPAGPVTYDQCRGSVGNPVPAGVFCNDDISSIFGNLTPQPTFAPRISNPTKHRNLDVGRGAIGSFLIDTRTLSNGMHTIAWGVTDSAGRTEGIGSRFFTVLNATAADMPAADAAPSSTRTGARSPAITPGDARRLEALAPAVSEVLVRTGFDADAPFEPLEPGDDGVRRVQLAAAGRVELDLGAAETGYLEANGSLRDLPLGSSLDPASGRFAWMPPAGYLGTYRLSFVSGDARTTVEVTVRPLSPAAKGEGEIRMALDTPRSSESVSTPFTLAGWALDPRAGLGSGIGAVHVWARRLDIAAVPSVFLGAARLGEKRSDVARAFGPQFNRAGYSLPVGALSPGRYEITAFAWNRRTNRWEDASTVSVTLH